MFACTHVGCFQRIIHEGKPQSDAIKLVDLFNQHTPKTDPVPFFIVVGQVCMVPLFNRLCECGFVNSVCLLR